VQQECFEIPEDFKVPVATRGDASRLGTRGGSRDQVLTLSRRQVQGVGRIKAGLRLHGDAPAHDLLLRALRGLLRAQ
jgi:hypothetical protein